MATITKFDARAMRALIEETSQGKLTYGITFLDDACGGIFKNDLVVLTALSSRGKTELGTHIASVNAKAGKRVYFYALEAYKYEIQARISYKLAAKKYFQDENREKIHIGFQQYLDNTIDKAFLPYAIWGEEEAERIYKDTLFTVYRDSGRFSEKEFVEEFNRLDMEADLIVVDHLQFFDFEEGNEYQALSSTVKTIRDMVLLHNIPVILISHVSKPNTMKGFRKIMPDKYDLHGSSNIGKVASRVIVIGDDPTEENHSPKEFNTLLRVAKNRWNSSTERYAAKLIYNLDLNAYSSHYRLAELKNYDTELEIVSPEKTPSWAKGVAWAI